MSNIHLINQILLDLLKIPDNAVMCGMYPPSENDAFSYFVLMLQALCVPFSLSHY